MPRAGQELGGKQKCQSMVSMQRNVEIRTIIGDIQWHEKQIQAQLIGALL